MKPLAIDLCCGLGGWAEGLLAEGYEVIGYDTVAHDYGTGGYPGTLIIQDITTLHGSQFKDATLFVASPPCQKYSYMAMPWSRAKAQASAIEEDTTGKARCELNLLFDTCFRLQREASEAAGHHIPMVVENVRGAQKWVGRAAYHYGSFYLWGDVPALMPIVSTRAVLKHGVAYRANGETNFHASADRATKNDGGSWFAIGSPGQKVTVQNPDGRKVPSERGRRTDPGNGARFTTRDCGVEAVKVPGISFSGHKEPGYRAQGFNVTAAQRYREEAPEAQKAEPGSCKRLPGAKGGRISGWPHKQNEDGVKFSQSGDAWFDGKPREDARRKGPAAYGSRSNSRKAASAMIAKIPFPLAQHIARSYKPLEVV